MRAGPFLPTSALRVALPVFCLLALFPSGCRAAASEKELGGRSKPLNKAAAADAELQLDLGTVALSPPRVAEVFTYQTWTLVYTAGRAGIRPGGGIRIGLRQKLSWSQLQTSDPQKEGYVSAESESGAPVRVTVDVSGGNRNVFFTRYQPWQSMVEILLPERGLSPGETVRVTLGDRNGGSPGVRIQPFDEESFVFKSYIDTLGDGVFLPLEESPSVRIVAAAPHRLAVVMPSDAVAGQPTWCIVRAEDRYGNPAVRYRGTVRLAATGGPADLPAVHTFSADDAGTYRFDNIVFHAVGHPTLSATDGAFLAVGNPIRVTAVRAPRLLLWGELHGHTLQSDGRGTVEQYYDFAERVAGLDFCAVTDHAYQLPDETWEHSKEVTNAFYEPGRFVTLQAYEWSGLTAAGGDHNVYFLDSDPPIYRTSSYYEDRNPYLYHGETPRIDHVEDLFEVLARNHQPGEVLAIPHYAGRRANPAFHASGVQRLIEVFSEKHRSESWIRSFLNKGYRLGIVAAGDDHRGNPGYGYHGLPTNGEPLEIGMALTAVYARDRTREAVFEALYSRQAYATTGDRILLEVSADGHPMGSEYAATTAPTLEIEALGTAPIERVEIKKDGEVVYLGEPHDITFRLTWQDSDFVLGRGGYYYVHLVQSNREEAISSPIWVQ